ncbi:NUDIX hydrolase, partial [Candidatus Pacearchaeota archaeon]|nr:NUDIX hydrolase [Candidatus Pacearchaeota archaeon]
NKLAYHIKNLVKKNAITKDKDTYKLSESHEHLIPYLSEKTSPLPVVLIHVGNKTKCFLHKRKKRPFLNMLSLPGGRLTVGESIEEASTRIMKDKFKINTKFKKINSVSLEHVERKKKIHSFLLIFVSAVTNEEIKLTPIKRNKEKIISSDYELLLNDLEKTVNIKTLSTKA